MRRPHFNFYIPAFNPHLWLGFVTVSVTANDRTFQFMVRKTDTRYCTISVTVQTFSSFRFTD